MVVISCFSVSGEFGIDPASVSCVMRASAILDSQDLASPSFFALGSAARLIRPPCAILGMASASNGQGAKRKRDESDEDAGQSLTASASGEESRVPFFPKNPLRRELRNADVGVDLEESFWKLLLLEVDQTLLLVEDEELAKQSESVTCFLSCLNSF